MLNLACALVDAGLVSALLWTFELREQCASEFEQTLGARMHTNLSAALHAGSRDGMTQLDFVASVDLLLRAGVEVRVARLRLLGVLETGWEAAWSENVSGPLADSSGNHGTEQSETSAGTCATFAVGGTTSDSLVRHFVRSRQA